MENTNTIPAPVPATLDAVESATALGHGLGAENSRLLERLAAAEAAAADLREHVVSLQDEREATRAHVANLEADLMDAGLALLAGLPGGIKVA